MLLKKVLRDLTQRKLRCILTIIGLGVAVISITGFAIASDSVMETSRRMLGANTANAFIVVHDGPWNQSCVAGIDYIDDYEPTYLHFTSTDISDEYSVVYMNGIDMAKVQNGTSVAGVVLDEGNIPSPSKNEILFDASAAKALDVKIGDFIEISLPLDSGHSITINLTISGLAHNVRYVGYTFAGGVDIWMSLSRVQTLLEKPNLFDTLYLKISEEISEGDLIAILETITSRLEENGISVIGRGIFRVNSSYRISLLNTINIIVIFVTITGLIIGGVLAATTIQMAIASEKEDIALLKIIGGKKGQVFSIYLLEVFILGLLGAIIGLILSIIGAYCILKLIADPLGLSNIVFIVSLKGIILGFAVPILTAVLFSLPVIFSVLQVSPLDAFRVKSSPKKNKGKSKSRFMLLQYALVNISKKKVRLALNMVMISLAVSSIMGLQVTTHSVVTSVHDMFNSHPSDITIDMQQNENETVVRNILDSYFQNNSADEIENYDCFWWRGGGLYDSEQGFYHFISLLGVHTDTFILDQFELINGSSLTDADEGKSHIVISKTFKEKIMETDLTVGSEVELICDSANDNFTVIGIINEQMNEGRMVYMPLSTMHRFLNVEGQELINTVYIELKDQAKDIEIASAMRKDENIRARGWVTTPISYQRESSMKTANFFILLGTVVTILGVIVAIIGGTNSFSMAALEREREIGILKLAGAKPRWIIGSFLTEGMILGLIAGAIGTIIGVFGLSRVLCSLVSNEFLIEIIGITKVFHVFIGICAGVLTGVLAAIYPGYKASATSVISALKYE